MKAIVAVDANWAIGLDNDLLFSLPTDMKHFRSKTLDKVVVMGHSTLKGFPDQKPLPQRTNVVLSRNQELHIPGATVCHSLEELTLFLQQFDSQQIMIVGGQTIYEQMLDYCSRIYVTKVNASRTADSHFPNLDILPNWKQVHTSELFEDNGITFTVNEYENRQVKSLERAFTPPSIGIRGTLFGVDTPKICLPILEATLPELIKECERGLVAGTDLIEWRADTFGHLGDGRRMVAALKEIRGAIGNLPLLFTIRSKEEGGQSTLSAHELSAILQVVIESGEADLIDMELALGNAFLQPLLTLAKTKGVHVILSSHNFDDTPPKEQLLSTLRTMEDLGADIPKIAVYPRNPADVLTLLSVSEEFSRTTESPFIAISMSWLGSISRVAGEFFGSAVTFGSGTSASAPGQIDVRDLRQILVTLEQPEQKGFL